jgi:hypothetical protein
MGITDHGCHWKVSRDCKMRRGKYLKSGGYWIAKKENSFNGRMSEILYSEEKDCVKIKRNWVGKRRRGDVIGRMAIV